MFRDIGTLDVDGYGRCAQLAAYFERALEIGNT